MFPLEIFVWRSCVFQTGNKYIFYTFYSSVWDILLSSKSYYRIYSAPLTGGDLKISYKVPEKVQKFLFKSLGLVCRPFKLHNSTRSEIFCSTHCPTKSGPQVRSRFRAKHRLLDLPAVLIQQDGVGPHAKTGSAAPQSPHAVLGKIGVVRREISW